MKHVLVALVSFVLLLRLGAGMAQEPPEAVALTTNKTITVDGTLDPEEWKGVKPIGINQTCETCIDTTGHVGSDADLSYDLYIVHDGETLYFGFDVTDDSIQSDSGASTWDDDCVEIFCNADNEGTGQDNDGRGFQLLITSDGRTDGSDSGPLGLGDDWYGAQTTAKGFCVEVAIPFDSFDTGGGESLAVGDRIGFTVNVDDDDNGGGREHQFWWYAVTGDSWNNQQDWGFLVISDKLVSLVSAGPDQRIDSGQRVTLHGEGPGDATSFSWKQTGGELYLEPALQPSPDSQEVWFDTAEVEVGFILTFELTVISTSEGTSTDEVQITVLAVNAPRIPPSNLRTQLIDMGFRLFWDPVLDANLYELHLEYLPGIWIPYAPNVDAAEYDMADQEPGAQVTVKIIGKNKYGKGAESEPISVTIMRNAALPAPTGSTPPTAQVSVGEAAVPALNDGILDRGTDSSGDPAKTEDFWGFVWDQELWFDEVVYYMGEISHDGGWFTDLTLEYTKDGSTWLQAPNVRFNPPYDFTNAPGGRAKCARYEMSLATVRGTGIRILGTPGGLATYTSIAELEVYGDQTRSDLVVQGLDLEVPERGTVTLDGSYSMSLIADIITYSWSQTSGPTVEIPDATAAITTFTAPAVEEDTLLVFSLTAGDGTNEATDDVRITVKNVTTTAVAGLDQTVEEGALVTFDGTGSQTATGVITYSWAQTAGPEVALSDAGAAVCSFTAPEIWPYVQRLTFRLDVEDGEGGTSSDEVNVNVTNSVFEVRPLGTGYFQDVLHLGNTPEDRFLSPLDLSLDTNDYLADWGGQANVNPVEGQAYDFTDTDISTTVNPMVWTPIHSDSGWFGNEALDTFGQIYHIYVFSPEERDARVRFRHDDEARIWNNGEIAASRNGSDGNLERHGDFILNDGINSMTLRFEEATASNHIAARITDRNDVPYTDLSYALSVRVPLPAAYGVRTLPDSYPSPGTVIIQVSLRADPENLPGTIAVKEILPEGVTIADAGGGTPGAGTLTWTLDGVASTVVSYSLSVPAGTTAGLIFAGDVNGEDTLGDSETYAVPSAPQHVTLDMMFGAQLTWSPPPEEGAGAYRVYRSVDGGDWEQVGFISQTFYTEGVVEGSTYSYKVMAVSKNGVEGPFCEATEAMTVTVPTVVEAENYNYGGGEYPGYENCPAANEAPDSDTVGTPQEYDFFFATDVPADDTRRFYRPNDNCGMETREATPNIGWTTIGDWWRYTLDVPEPGPGEPTDGWARVGLKIASNPTCELYWDEGLIGTVTASTGDWGAFVWAPLADAFRTTPGEHTLRVKMVSGGMNIDSIGVGFNLAISREAIFEDDFEDYTNLYDWNDLETVGNWDVTNGSGEPDVGWRLWSTTGDYLGDETDDRNPAITGMTGNYVITDSDLVGTADLNEELVTPDIDCTEYIRLKLDFSKNFRVYPDDADHTQIAEVDIREVGGGWVNLLSYNVNSIDPSLDPAIDSTPEKLDLSAYDGKTFQLRWHFYEATWDWWWAIDNIMVSGDPKPVPPPPKGVILSVGIAAGNLSVTWSVFGTETYYIEGSFDMLTWHELAGPLTGTSSPPILMSGSGAFYRVRAE